MSAFSVYCHVEGPIETFKQCYLGADHLTFEGGGKRFQKEYYCKLWREEKKIVPGLADKKYHAKIARKSAALQTGINRFYFKQGTFAEEVHKK